MALNTSMEMINLERKAKDAINIAAARGFKIPTDYTAAWNIAQAAAKVRDAPAPAPRPMPTKPADVAKWISAVAQERAEWRDTQAVAGELYDQANRAAMAAAVDAVPEFMRQICDTFDTALTEYRRLMGVAPRGVSGQMTGDQFELHAELLRAVDAMTAAAADRGRLALLTDEGQDLGSDGLWLVLDPAGTTSVGQVTAALSQYRGRIPVNIDEWEQIDALGLRMARAGDVARRREELAALVYASGMAHDGGMVDKTYDQAAQLPGGTSPGALTDDFDPEQEQEMAFGR